MAEELSGPYATKKSGSMKTAKSIFKYIIAALLVICTGYSSTAQSNVGIGIYQSADPTKIEVRIQPESNLASGTLISEVVFTVRWSEQGISIANEMLLPLIVNTLGDPVLSDGYYYQRFRAEPSLPLDQAVSAGSQYVVARFSFSGASPDYHFELVNNAWTSANNANYYLEVMGVNRTGDIIAPIAPPRHLVSFSVDGGNGNLTARVDGTNISSGADIRAGKNVVFQASPVSGYRVKQWTLNGNDISGNTSNTYTLSGLSQDSDVQVSFEAIPTHAVTFSVDGSGGSLTARVGTSGLSSGTQVQQGSIVVFTATPADGYQVQRWTRNGSVVSGNTSTSYTVSNLNADTQVQIRFEPIPTRHTVSFSVDGSNGNLTASVDGSPIQSGSMVDEGSTIHFTASPDQGYRVSRWTRNGGVVEGNTTTGFSLANLSEDTDVRVRFEVIPTPRHVVTFSVEGAGGTIEALVGDKAIASGDLVDEGSQVWFHAHPESGYRLKQWLVNGFPMTVTTGNSLGYNHLSAALQVQVVFEKIPFVIGFSVAGEGGSLSATLNGSPATSGGTAHFGDLAAFTAIPDEGFRVKQWKVNGDVVEGNTGVSFTIPSVEKDAHVEVYFELLPDEEFVLHFETGTEGGMLEASLDDGTALNPGDHVTKGSKVIFTAIPDEGFQVAQWIVNGEVVGGHTANTLELEGVEGELVIEVIFEAIPPVMYTITFEVAGNNGVLTAVADGTPLESGDQVAEGGEVTLTAIPDEGYTVTAWTVNGEPVEEKRNGYLPGKNANGEPRKGDNAYILVIHEVMENVHVEVQFGPTPASSFQVTFGVDGEGGRIEAFVDASPILSGDSVEEGKALEFRAIPEEGFMLKHWMVDGEIHKTESFELLYVENLEKDLEVLVVFQTDVTSVPGADEPQLIIFPNPAAHGFKVESPVPIQEIQVYDLHGRLLLLDRPGTQSHAIDRNGLPNGIYYIIIETHQGVHRKTMQFVR